MRLARRAKRGRVLSSPPLAGSPAVPASAPLDRNDSMPLIRFSTLLAVALAAASARAAVDCASAPSGTACDDGNACTQLDTCSAGACRGPLLVICAPPMDSCQLVACRPATGCTVVGSRADGTSCNDGNPCTRTDSCRTGVCVGGDPVVCVASDQCHTGVCITGPISGGSCAYPNRPDGSSCSDGDACTLGDTCQAGACTSGAPGCAPPDQCHTAADSCDPVSGCSYPARPDGTPCDDGSACTRSDTCEAGLCTGGDPVTCVPSATCRAAGTCDPTTGLCSDPPATDGAACDDGRSCTAGDACRAGLCTATVSTCACSSDDGCQALDQCHQQRTCDVPSGACSPSLPVADGAACDDGSLCTSGETCQAGACGAPRLVVTCPPPADDCHLDGACDGGTGECVYPRRPDGAACSGGRCTAGTCVAAPPPKGGCSGGPGGPASLLVLAVSLAWRWRRARPRVNEGARRR